MKLRNKKTGKIVEFRYLQTDHVAPLVLTTYEKDNPEMCTYNSLAELNEEWEDVPEEPRKYWFIDADFGICGDKHTGEPPKYKYEIGNYFETKEDAEKAVEKLKAWKRLKDKGFSIYSWDYEFDMVDKPAQTIILRASAVNSSNTDLDLLFGGEE